MILEDKCVKIDSNCAADGYQASSCFKCKDDFFLLDTVCYRIPGTESLLSDNTGNVQNTGTGGGSIAVTEVIEEEVFDEDFGVLVRRVRSL